MFLTAELDLSLPLNNPVIIFSLVLFIILFAPILLQRIKVPHIIGLIIAGTIVGPYGLNLLQRDSSIVLFGTVGLLYIMFLAGLEIDLGEFRKNRTKIIVFGLTTFLLPLGVGSLASYYLLGYDWMASLLLASMFSTHTLVSYPIASRYGIARNRAVTLTIGGTMITDILALLILAGIAGMAKEQVSSAFWMELGISSLVFVTIVFFGFPIVIRWFFKNFADSVSQYIFVLATVFLASFLAEAAGLESIIGAFFSGLVLNRFIPHQSPLMNRIDFVGNALFIPFFLISVGMLVDVTVLTKGWGAAKVAAVITIIAILTKYLAALITQKAFRLTNDEGKLIFGLSSSHAAATLAIILVGYNIIIGETATGDPIRLLNEDVLNGTILLILVSCAVSSFLVEKAARNIAISESDQNTDITSSERILVSIAYPETVSELIDFGLMLRGKQKDIPVYALHVTDEEHGTNAGSGKKVIDQAVSRAAATENVILPIHRFDLNITNGIVYTIKEQGISDVLIGLHHNSREEDFLGSNTENLLKRVFENVYIYKAVQPINTIKRMVVLVPRNAEAEPGFLNWYQKLSTIAKTSGMPILIFGTEDTLIELRRLIAKSPNPPKLELNEFSQWDDFLIFSRELGSNDLFVIVASRKGYPSYVQQLNKLPYYLDKYFQKNSFLIIYPKQLEVGINMEDVQQADSGLMDTLSDQITEIGKAGSYIKRLFGRNNPR